MAAVWHLAGMVVAGIKCGGSSLLTEIVDRYKGHSCGYGRNRNFSKTHLLDQGSEKLTRIDRLTNQISDRPSLNIQVACALSAVSTNGSK